MPFMAYANVGEKVSLSAWTYFNLCQNQNCTINPNGPKKADLEVSIEFHVDPDSIPSGIFIVKNQIDDIKDLWHGTIFKHIEGNQSSYEIKLSGTFGKFTDNKSGIISSASVEVNDLVKGFKGLTFSSYKADSQNGIYYIPMLYLIPKSSDFQFKRFLTK